MHMHHSAHPTSAYLWAFPFTRQFELELWLLRMSLLPPHVDGFLLASFCFPGKMVVQSVPI